MTSDKFPAPPPSNQGNYKKSSGDNGGVMKIAGIALAVTIVVLIAYGMLIGGFATKKYTDATFVTTATITQLQKDISDSKAKLDESIAGMPTEISTQVSASVNTVATRIAQTENDIRALNTQIGTANTNYANLQNNYSSIQSSISQINSDITGLKTQITTFITDTNAKLATYETRLSVLETKAATPTPTITTTTGDVIPNVSMKIDVTDEGYINSTDNSTNGQIKLTLTNNGTNDITDIKLFVYVNFEDSISTVKPIVLTSSYGIWSIRSKQTYAIQLQGKIATLAVGQTRRIYIDINSFDLHYITGGIVYISDCDIEVIDWNAN